MVWLLLCWLLPAMAWAQPLVKSAVQVDPGNTKQTGQTFGYRLNYNCSSTSGPCLGAQVVDLLPLEVQFVSTVPASPAADVQTINVTPNFMGSGRTRVQFVLINPLPAGNSGDLLINVRFPAGSTPNGTVASNTADGINLGATPGTLTTPPVNVTAVASAQFALAKTLQTGPANLDLPETYRLRISVPNAPGALNLTAIGPVVDTLPPGTVFNGATPAADCQPGCVGTTPATVTWSAPCSVPLAPGGNCDIAVNVTFPSATFPSGTNVTNSFTATGTPLGLPSQNLGVGQVTHPVTAFVPAPGIGFSKNMAGGTPNPPTLNQSFSYDVNLTNNGNVPIDNLVVTDVLPVELQLASVTTGAYNGLADFAASEGVRVSYEKNTALGVFTLWGSSPVATTSTTLTAPPPGLGAGEYITRVRWEYGQAAPGMAPSNRPLLSGRIINPDNAGGPVAIGDSIQNCADSAGVYTAGPTNVNRNDCETFVLSGPFVQLNPAKDLLSGAGPFNPGQSVGWRLRVRSAPQSSDPVPLSGVIATDLLPVNLSFVGWTFDDQGTGLPAPQVFDQIPNFAGTGRTLLRWRWNAGSGSLGVNQQVWINITTTIRNGTPSGNLSNDFTLDNDSPGLAQRCSGSSQADPLDLDGDADTAETLCRGTGTAAVAPIAQLVSSKTVQGLCDGGSVSVSAGTLPGGATNYRLRVQNAGTVPMQNFVLVDILPFPGDTGVRDTNPRGSQFQLNLSEPIAPPAGTVVYYSNSGNPCRGEVGGPTTGCTPPDWTTVPPMPISLARSFKIEFGSRVVAPFDFVEFEFGTVTPGSVVPGQTAFNSFAYQADRADGLGSLAAEPQKVGIALGACTGAALGDFVFLDGNANGVQDDGPTSGINGVPARMYNPGVDGIPGNLDDDLLSVTVTQNSPGGTPGWYQFPGLAPGNYYVCFAPPADLLPTLRDQGADTTDSDVDSLTLCTPLVNLPAKASNQTLDFGVVRAAALGNYVWYDDGDGIQDESPLDGVNGVRVELFADDGDSTCEAGTGDALVASTVTDDDPSGAPGYYSFGRLLPGVGYCVRFVRPAPATAFTIANAGGNDSRDSDANLATGVTPVVVLAQGEFNATLDAGLVQAAGTLALGDQVWADTDNDGVFEPQNGEQGIDNVVLDLYLDSNGDGQASTGEHIGRTSTFTSGGFVGRYRFEGLAPGNYIVVIPGNNFGGGEPLAGLRSSNGNDPAPDPDDDVNGDDNGTPQGALVIARPVTLTDNGEPTSEDGDNDTNLTVDFGFVSNTLAPAPVFDYGDAPDSGLGTAGGNYQTVATDQGASHRIDVVNAPRLGACVDGDDGLAQDGLALSDDALGGNTTTGVCAATGGDEDGVVQTGSLVAGGTATFNVSASGGAGCRLDAWLDFNGNGVFGDGPGEQIATNLVVPVGPPTVLSPVVPANAAQVVYARFRCSSAGGLPPTGTAADGEVEDYRYALQATDFGDAPASYGTQGAGAARHDIDPATALYLGACVDFETNGQPGAPATGDDGSAGTGRVGLCFDDEDGFVPTTALAACTSAQATVTASAAGRLDAWVDFSADGDFLDPGEQVFTNQALTAGANALSFNVPCAAVNGPSYVRLRLSPKGGATITPTGTVVGGEVEDHAVSLGGVDFGDAPDTYGTLFASNGPRHVLVAGFSLGATVDSEAEGQPNTTATGDGADEDGVTVAPLVACSTANVPVSLTNTAGIATPLLDAWIDFDGDGAFNDPRDRIATSLALVSGANSVAVNVPCNTPSRSTFARFRLSAAGVATPAGQAGNGEIEDHAIEVRGLDFGDLPDPMYPTLLASNGARHVVLRSGNPQLGVLIDTEPDGQPSVTATGDDTAGGPDDEGGVADEELAIVVGTQPAIDVTVSNPTSELATLCGFVDANADGDFGDAGEQAQSQVAPGMSFGLVTLNFGTVPTQPPTQSYARFRLSTGVGCAVTGLAPDGEVEDYRISINTFDMGDLPDTGAGTGAGNYPTLRTDNGPRHFVVPGLRLGATVDLDPDGQPGAAANGDDNNGTPDDEDGVTLPPGGFFLGSPARVTVNATNTLATAATVCGFIDFNADGDFADSNEAAQLSVPAGTSATDFVMNFGLTPVTAPLSTYARFRISTQAGCSPVGEAIDGEVEDHVAGTTGVGQLTLGDRVFVDANNDGVFGAGETGLGGVPVSLYRASDSNACVPTGASLSTMTTNANGEYRFVDLLPDFYIVEVLAPSSYVGSTGSGRYAATGPFEPAPDPDNDVNNDDNGTGVSGAIRSCAVELRAETKPVDDGDTDFNTNLTVDFGLVFNFDLALRKSLAPGQPPVLTSPYTVDYVITVFNQGTVPATQVRIVDQLPPGMAPDDAAWTSSGPGRIERTLAGPIAPGASAQVGLRLVVVDLSRPQFINRAEIAEARDDSGVLRIDRDSTPDDQIGNDGVPVDDAIDNSDGDEDDSDFATVGGPGIPIPAGGRTGWLLLLALLAVVAARRRVP